MRLPSLLRSLAAPRPAAARPVPTPAELASLDVGGFVRRLDHNLTAITSESSLSALLPPAALADLTASDPRFAGVDSLFRSTLRGLLVATSFRDLADEARVHPAVQDRMWSAMDEMDTAVCGVGDALSALSAAERAEISRALRDEPELANRVLAALDAEAQSAGVSPERREHLQKMGKTACFRLRISTSGFIDEYTSKVRRTQPRRAPEAERYLAAQMGDAAFEQEREWQFAVHREWLKILAAEKARLTAPEEPPGGISADDAYAPPTAPLAPPPAGGGSDSNSGKTVLKVGAWLFGIGLMCGATGALLVSSRTSDVVIAGLISFTAAAVLSLGGIVCLLVGGILRLRARSRAIYELDSGS